VPEWLRNGVIYQIFPDRFYQKRAVPLTQGEIERKRPDYILQPDWSKQPIYYPDPRTGEIMNNDFFGGNFAGIAAKLPYLKDLGVSIIYLNPIFEAYSNHRYDTGDYLRIDALLGDNDDFASLCAQAKGFGIRIILDGVFNHTGSDSMFFNKGGYYKSLGAYQSRHSKYYGWYSFEEYPEKYDSWWGILTLPNVNESEPDFIKYIISGENSVVKYWLRQGASGWRLDVVDELPGEFVKELRAHIKNTDPDAAIIGEVWEDASNKESYGKRREYLLGYELDSVMNYVFKKSLISFMLGNIGAARVDAENRMIAENYPKESYYSLMNLIGGHDVERILTIMSEPPPDLTRDQKAMHKPTGRKHRLGIKRVKIMSLIQMTFPGAPSVYYGDEAGMAGFEDPFNRGAFPWDGMDAELHGWYRKIISLRNSYAALRTGGFRTVYADGAGYAYIREIRGGADAFGAPAQDGFALIAVNRDKERPVCIEIDLAGRNIAGLRYALESDKSPPGSSHTADAPLSNHVYIDGRLTLTVEPLGYRMLIAEI
jgi:4-alpha-glucanotransferase